MILYKGSNSGGRLETVQDPKQLFTGTRVKVQTATFDSHVLPVAKAMNITTAILKIDIEGSECTSLQAADQFLTEINVLFIIMEVMLSHELHSDLCMQRMFNVLRSFSYYPFKPDSIGVDGLLNTKTYREWQYLDIS